MAPFARAKQEISTDQMFRSTTVLKCSSTTTSWVRVRGNKTQRGRKKESRHNDDHELIIIHTTVPLSLFFTSFFILRRPQFSLLHSGDALHGPFGNGKTEREGPMIITSSNFKQERNISMQLALRRVPNDYSEAIAGPRHLPARSFNHCFFFAGNLLTIIVGVGMWFQSFSI